MPNPIQPNLSSTIWKQILTDTHFWVPAIVLVAGLLVLLWIQ